MQDVAQRRKIPAREHVGGLATLADCVAQLGPGVGLQHHIGIVQHDQPCAIIRGLSHILQWIRRIGTADECYVGTYLAHVLRQGASYDLQVASERGDPARESVKQCGLA